MKVELLDEQFHPIEGFSGGDAGSIAADGGLDCPVIWPRGGLDAVRGRTARVLVTMPRADGEPDGAAPRLYAITLVDARGERR